MGIPPTLVSAKYLTLPHRMDYSVIDIHIIDRYRDRYKMNKMPSFLNMSELLMHPYKYTVNRNQSISIHSEHRRHPELWRENSLPA